MLHTKTLRQLHLTNDYQTSRRPLLINQGSVWEQNHKFDKAPPSSLLIDIECEKLNDMPVMYLEYNKNVFNLLCGVSNGHCYATKTKRNVLLRDVGGS